MGGSAGGQGNIREISQPEVASWFQSMLKQENAFQAQDPNLQGAIDVSQQSLKDLPGLQKQLTGYSGELGNYQSQLGAFGQQLGGYKTQAGQLYNQAGQQGATLQGYLGGANGINATIASHGALSPEAAYQANLQAASGAEAQGTGRSVGTLVSQYANREAQQQQRFNTAYQQGLQGQQAIAGVRGQQSGLLGQEAGITGQQAGITQGQAALTGQRASMLNQFQGLASNVINQLTGARGAVTANFAPLMGLAQAPVFQNLNSRIQGAAINEAGASADDSKRAGLISSGIKALGSVAMGAAGSDERLKTKIRSTGLETIEGIPLKTWEYRTNPGVKYLGATAQDIEKVRPDAVITDPLSTIKLVTREFMPMKLSAGA